jgi:hypothetical protein
VVAQLEAEVRRVAGPSLVGSLRDPSEGPFIETGTDKLDYAVLTFRSQEASREFEIRSRADPVRLGSHALHVQAGGRKAIVEFVAAQQFLDKHFVKCRNPAQCRGMIYVGLGGQARAGSLHCRRCEYTFCNGCRTADHSPAPCRLIRTWEEEGGSSLESQEDLATKHAIYQITKKCPKCGEPIEKNVSRCLTNPPFAWAPQN